MSKRIYLNSAQLKVLKEDEERVTFYKFYTEIKKFLKELLDNPLKPNISDFFISNGITKPKLLNKLLDRNVVTKKETINEPLDGESNKKSMHFIQYKIPKKNFDKKIHRLYTYYFE